MNDLDHLAEFAEELADLAGAIARKYFRAGFDIISKADQSPVTIADREIEQVLRNHIQAKRPQDGIIGEEFGAVPTQNGLTWVIDPIDGTKSFTIGRATFGTLIGLCDNETPVIGIIDQPILRERWLGVTGLPTLFNGREVRCRACPDLDTAIFGTGSPSQIGPERFARIDAACRYTVYQGDCYFYGLMATGAVDVVVEDQLGIYDYLALAPIVKGAGGIITDWSGAELTLSRGANALAVGDPRLHEKILALL